MEIKVDRNEFLKSIARLQTIIEKKSNMPILSTVLLTAAGEGVDVWGTDLELGLKEKLHAEVMEEGSITISGRTVFEILRESKKATFHIKEEENNRIFLSDGVTEFNLASLPPDEYPAFSEPEGVVTAEMDAGMLGEMIDKTIYAVTLEEAGFKLSGIFTEIVAREGTRLLRMVSTDGHRLSLIDKELEGIGSLQLGSGVMIPKKGMSELNKLCAEGGSIRIGFKEKTCVAKRESSLLVIRLLESKFPDYHAVIPKEEKHVLELERIYLLDAMKKMLILSTERYRAVKITLEKDSMELVSANPDLGEARESMALKYKGPRLEAGFNPRYFIDTLQAMESDAVRLGFVDATKPCILRGEADQGFLGLIMPMRL